MGFCDTIDHNQGITLAELEKLFEFIMEKMISNENFY